MADRLQEFAVLLSGLMTKTIIAANQAKALPGYPFIIYQSITEDRDNLSVMKSELINDDLDILETKTRRVENVIQFDIYNSGVLNVAEAARNFVDGIEFTYRRQILEADFGIVNIGNIIDNTSLEQVKSRYRKTVEVTIDYIEENEREIQNLQSIEYGLEGEDPETVSREE